MTVENLRVLFDSPPGPPVVPVNGVSFWIGPGERVGLVGESGSGKSLTALAIMGLVGKLGGRIDPTSVISFRGRNLVTMPERDLQRIRGRDIAVVFQDPQSSFNPVYTVGHQVIEAIRLGDDPRNDNQARERAIELFDLVRLPEPHRVADRYPHELSGGMRQRAMIALALARDPALLIADEPTTALDVTVQAEILDLMLELCESRSLAILLITHDLGIVAGFTKRCLVMYGGKIVEEALTERIYRSPKHPYTAALLGSVPPLAFRAERLTAIPGVPPEPRARPSGCLFHPRCRFRQDRCGVEVPPLIWGENRFGDGVSAVACHFADELDLSGWRVHSAEVQAPPVDAPGDDVLVSIRNLTKVFPGSGMWSSAGAHVAVNDVSLDVYRGEALGLIGQSGSGKTTLARALLRFLTPTTGRITLEQQDITRSPRRWLRRNVQMIFQDPGSSLDPRFMVRDILAEPLRIHRLWREPGYDEARLRELISLVNLPNDSLERYPHQFSGGQRQRIAIARALTLRPTFLVCDEPASSLDVSVRASVLNLLADLRDKFALTLLFITHDLSLARFLCSRVAVMYQGKLVELAATDDLFRNPQHEHTRELLAAQPEPDPEKERERRRLRSSALAR